MESPKERQEHEIQALKAIFAEDLSDLRENCVNGEIWHPIDVIIKLFPQQDSRGLQKAYAEIDLRITCSEEYPNIVPQLEVKNSKGLSKQQVAELQHEIEMLSEKLRGEVMIFEIAQHVQKFLVQYNNPGFSSFYDEMLNRHEQELKKQEERKKMEEDIKIQKVQEEIEKHQRNLRFQTRISQTSESFDELSSVLINEPEKNDVLANSVITSSRHSISESSDTSPCYHKSTVAIHFTCREAREVLRGKCLGHYSKGCVVFSVMDKASGELFILKEWPLKFQPSVVKKDKLIQSEKYSRYIQQLTSIDQELNYLLKLKHSHLVHYVNMTYLTEKDKLLVYTLQECSPGASLEMYLTDSYQIETDLLRHCTRGILDALIFLHKNNVVHKDLRVSSIFINKSGSIQLSDYSLDKRLSLLYESSTTEKIEPLYPLSLGRGGKKADIYRLGIVILSLIKGYICNEILPEIPKHLPSKLKDFLEKCLTLDEHDRWSAQELLSHSFLRCTFDRYSPKKIITKPQDEIGYREQENDPDIDIGSLFPANKKGQSRVQNEFEVLKWLGKGAFGDVLKVRNKLDGGIYAIKRIRLNPRNKHLNKKITREVKLLSILNHENVVRYFNSWIECAVVDTKDVKNATQAHTQEQIKHTEAKRYSSLEGPEVAAPSIREYGVEWTLPISSRNAESIEKANDENPSSDDESFDSITKVTESSGGVEFIADSHVEPSSNGKLESDSCNENVSSEKDETLLVKEVHFMYIQMEFCEKSTLRIAIDNNLWEDEQRVWRLFREIIEGLCHIHYKAMIHRDLKPVNIFLDSNDHVKIGDFGLATTNALSRSLTTTCLDVTDGHLSDHSQSFSNDPGDGSMTGQVGTALYAAPELKNSSDEKFKYNQMVDIYSLGITFFEMCYHPLSTAMERVKILGNLRKEEIIFPTDFTEEKFSRQRKFLRMMLNHDPGQRPKAFQLQESNDFPPLPTEEEEMQELIHQILSKPKSKQYNYLISECFKQDTEYTEEIQYYVRASKGISEINYLSMFETIKEKVIQIFQRHGAVSMCTPLLMPPNNAYDTDSSARVMINSGNIVTLPHNLRVNFARYVAWKGITHLKRYAVGKVFRQLEKDIWELYECAFDIVTPQAGSIMADAEILVVLWEISKEFSAFQENNCTILLNHTSLLTAVLKSCNINEEKYQEVYRMLNEAKNARYSKSQVQTQLSSLCLPEYSTAVLFKLIYSEFALTELPEELMKIAGRKCVIGSLAKDGIINLKAIVKNAEAFGVKCPILIAPGLMHNIQLYSGMMCQFTCDRNRSHRKPHKEVIAAGGRYNKMIATFRDMVKEKCQEQCAVGISISLENLLNISQEERIPAVANIVVGSLGQNPMTKEKAKIMSELWTVGIKSTFMEPCQSLEEIQDFSRLLSASHIVILKDTEQGVLRVRTWERDRFSEKKISQSDLIDLILRKQKSSNEADSLSSTPSARLESKQNSFDFTHPPQKSTSSQLIITFIPSDKINPNSKKRFELQIKANMRSVLTCMTKQVCVDVLAVQLDSLIIKSLAAFLEVHASNESFQKSVSTVIDKHPRNKKSISEVCDTLLDKVKCGHLVVLYSLTDNIYRLLL